VVYHDVMWHSNLGHQNLAGV